MPLLRLSGDPEVMARIKTDSNNDEHWWSELKKVLNAFTLGTGPGLEGVCILHLCGPFGKAGA
eukprot:gene1101-25414_t